MRGRLCRAAPLAQLPKCSGYIYCVHVNRCSAGIALIRELSVALCVYFSHTVSVNTVSHAKTPKKHTEKQCWIKSSAASFYERWHADYLRIFYDAQTRRDHFQNQIISKFNSDHFSVFNICPSSDWKWVNVCFLVWLSMFLCWTTRQPSSTEKRKCTFQIL